MNEKLISLDSTLVNELGLTKGNIVIPETFIKGGITYKITEIKEDAFAECTDLTSVTIPEGVINIGNFAFVGCYNLPSVNIPEGVVSIERFAFAGCINLTSVIIPEGVVSIGDYAFRNVPHITYHGSATGSPWGAKSMN